ncbi:MAG: hypothetical protein GEU99_23525 [Luteitalea sp.]|nr:hypothetical protein [Luteitalea sp.]
MAIAKTDGELVHPVGNERHRLPRGTITLTDTGRAVLACDVDRVARCGLDRWLGGVHLQGTGPTWRWDDAQGRPVYG